MKVVAINSSPKMNKGNTALILNPFLDGEGHLIGRYIRRRKGSGPSVS